MDVYVGSGSAASNREAASPSLPGITHWQQAVPMQDLVDLSLSIGGRKAELPSGW